MKRIVMKRIVMERIIEKIIKWFGVTLVTIIMVVCLVGFLGMGIRVSDLNVNIDEIEMDVFRNKYRIYQLKKDKNFIYFEERVVNI